MVKKSKDTGTRIEGPLIHGLRGGRAELFQEYSQGIKFGGGKGLSCPLRFCRGLECIVACGILAPALAVGRAFPFSKALPGRVSALQCLKQVQGFLGGAKPLGLELSREGKPLFKARAIPGKAGRFAKAEQGIGRGLLALGEEGLDGTAPGKVSGKAGGDEGRVEALAEATAGLPRIRPEPQDELALEALDAGSKARAWDEAGLAPRAQDAAVDEDAIDARAIALKDSHGYGNAGPELGLGTGVRNQGWRPGRGEGPHMRP